MSLGDESARGAPTTAPAGVARRQRSSTASIESDDAAPGWNGCVDCACFSTGWIVEPQGAAVEGPIRFDPRPRVRASARPPVRPSVRPSVRPPVRPSARSRDRVPAIQRAPFDGDGDRPPTPIGEGSRSCAVGWRWGPRSGASWVGLLALLGGRGRRSATPVRWGRVLAPLVAGRDQRATQVGLVLAVADRGR